MSSKLDLLTKLLIDRADEVVILHQDKIHCGCGEGFEDFSDIENHLVQSHEKLSNSSCTSQPLRRRRSRLVDILKSVVSKLSEAESCLVEKQLKIQGLPEKSYAVCLDEEAINGGEIRGLDCHECSASCWSFKTLKDHYMRQHPGTWACAETCSQVSRVLFTKPLKEHRLPKGWSYHYYCPLPSCKYHLSQNKSFPSYSLLKQHYSKMHAHRSKICGKCNAGKFL